MNNKNKKKKTWARLFAVILAALFLMSSVIYVRASEDDIQMVVDESVSTESQSSDDSDMTDEERRRAEEEIQQYLEEEQKRIDEENRKAREAAEQVRSEHMSDDYTWLFVEAIRDFGVEGSPNDKITVTLQNSETKEQTTLTFTPGDPPSQKMSPGEYDIIDIQAEIDPTSLETYAEEYKQGVDIDNATKFLATDSHITLMGGRAYQIRVRVGKASSTEYMIRSVPTGFIVNNMGDVSIIDKYEDLMKESAEEEDSGVYLDEHEQERENIAQESTGKTEQVVINDPESHIEEETPERTPKDFLKKNTVFIVLLGIVGVAAVIWYIRKKAGGEEFNDEGI